MTNRKFLFAAALTLLAAPAFAQAQPAQGGMQGGMGMGMRGGMGMAGVMGQHTMPATVTAVDTKTGVVDVNSEGFALKMHYPAASVADLKAGDKITLHLGFSKP
jgi:hypothetical protein